MQEENATALINRSRSIIEKVTIPMDLLCEAHIDVERGYATYLQIVCKGGKCNVSGDELDWKGRKWYMSKHMTDGEIVQTIFKAMMTAMEHELREGFLYRGRAIFDPHYDLDKLWELRGRDDSLKERKAT